LDAGKRSKARSRRSNIPTTVEYKRNGICVRIRPTKKDGKEYFVADYRVNGQRRLVWRTTLAEARLAASEAVERISIGQAEVLLLTSTDRLVYFRARDALDGTEKKIDTACQEYADAVKMLAGRASLGEVCRDWLKRNDVKLPKITVADAVVQMKKQAEADGKSDLRLKQLANVLDRFAESFNVEVHTLTPKLIADYLSALALAERTRRNHCDVIGFFNRWLVLRGYLAKGTDWLEGVQHYSARKRGEIEIYSPDELSRLIAHANNDMLSFIVIQAFAGLRHAEAARLDWQEIDLDDGFVEIIAAKSKTGERRLVPMHDNLKAWLLPLRKSHGEVCPYENTTKQLLKTAEAAGVEWKHNGLRHSFISYRVAECADVPRVADEAGNSPQIIRQHYLRRVKPAAAAQWFAVSPQTGDKVIPLHETSGATPTRQARP
jgi:integrase